MRYSNEREEGERGECIIVTVALVTKVLVDEIFTVVRSCKKSGLKLPMKNRCCLAGQLHLRSHAY